MRMEKAGVSQNITRMQVGFCFNVVNKDISSSSQISVRLSSIYYLYDSI